MTAAACPYCRGRFDEHDAMMICDTCATPHHKDCFTENGGCTVFGCVNAPGDEPKIRILIEDLGGSTFSLGHRNATAARTVAPAPSYPAASRENSLRVTPRFGILLERSYPAAPNLPWGLLLTFSLLTSGLFLLIWDLALARWLREVQPHSRSLYYYSAVALLHVLAVACLIGGQINQNDSSRIRVFGMAVILLSILGRFSMRKSLEDYFDQAGAMGLSLSEAMTFFFGSIYFQYHLNRLEKQNQEQQQAIA